MKTVKVINKILAGIIIIAVFFLVVGVAYSYYVARLSGAETKTSVTGTTGALKMEYDGGPELIASSIAPSTNPFITKTFTVKGYNTSNIQLYYQVKIIVDENTFSEDAITYTLTGSNTSENGNPIPNITTRTPINQETISLGIGNFTDNITNVVHTYELNLYFYQTETDQLQDLGKTFKAHVTLEDIDYRFDVEKGVNRPVLFTGMTPVIWDESFNETETTFNNPEWYDYNAKKWANAKTADGSYWVWIPRYAYKITSGYQSSTTGTIDIKFLRGTTNDNDSSTNIKPTEEYNADTKNTSMHHFLHPAFDVEGSKLGFWIAKYEPTAAEGVVSGAGSCDSADNVSTKTIKVIPGATSWRCINISNAYNATLNMKTNSTYGWLSSKVNPHMLTNIEWGAVTYLSKSTYGANTKEIWNNAYNQYRTGCSGTGVNANSESTCVVYNTTDGVNASTTHNIYGVYDMSGGAWERVMGNYNNLPASSGFNTVESVTNIPAKYISRYTTATEDLLNGVGMAYDTTIYGDAVYETSYNAYRYNGTAWEGNGAGSWYGDNSNLPRTSLPWFSRGGYWGSGTVAGLFSFNSANGNATVGISFRPAVGVG